MKKPLLKKPVLREVRDVFGMPPSALPARRVKSPRGPAAGWAGTWPDLDVVLGELRFGWTSAPPRPPRRKF